MASTGSSLQFLIRVLTTKQPMAVVAFLRRSQTSLDSYGQNVKVVLHGGEKSEAIIHTDSDFLIIYTVAMSSEAVDARYKFDTTKSSTSHRRRSFAIQGDSELIMPYSIKHKRMIKVDSRLSW